MTITDLKKPAALKKPHETDKRLLKRHLDDLKQAHSGATAVARTINTIRYSDFEDESIPIALTDSLVVTLNTMFQHFDDLDEMIKEAGLEPEPEIKARRAND